MRRWLVKGMYMLKLYAIYSIWKRKLMKHITIGTRASKLAMVQTQLVTERLQQQWPGLEIGIEQIRTTGDRVTDMPLSQIGGEGVFVTEIERALQERRIDLAVHSLKDLPTAQPQGLRLLIIGPREDVRDVLILNEQTTCVGTRFIAPQPQPELNERSEKGTRFIAPQPQPELNER